MLDNPSAGSPSDGHGTFHGHRRSLLRLATGLTGLSWLTPLATRLTRAAELPGARPRSAILIWLEGGPSQLETFDPHPGSAIAYGSLARQTRAPGVLIGEGFEQLSEKMDAVAVLRALTIEEGDHERAIYNTKTGYRPDPVLVHPSLGSIICHQWQPWDSATVDIPRHVSILAGGFAGRGGYLGDQYDAYRIGDPVQALPDMRAAVGAKRQVSRLDDLRSFNDRFLADRGRPSQTQNALGLQSLEASLRMMSSEQLDAFDVSAVPAGDRLKYGDTPFGRGCLAALRLIQAGVRCVEVTLDGWDSHIDNHARQAERIQILDPALASLIGDLRAQNLLDSTLVLCGGEFGRTPWLNGLDGRDHWPHGYAMVIAGCGIQGGRVVGQTNSDPRKGSRDPRAELAQAHSIHDVHATILRALGLEHDQQLLTPIGRPLKISQGQPIAALW